MDLVGTLGNVKVNVEMNKTNTLLRNINYFKEITKEEILSGTEIKAFDTLAVQINLTDLCFKSDKTVNYFWYRDESGRGIDNKVLVNISIPLIRKKVYTEGIESLDDLERYVGMMSMEKVKKAKELAKGDELRMEYIKDAKRVEKSTNFYDDFDYEATLISNYIQDGMAIGKEEGLKKGRIEERQRAIAKMTEIGLPIEKIIECFDLSEEEIKDLKRRLNSK